MKIYAAFGTLLFACSVMLAQSSQSQPEGQSTGTSMQTGSAQKSQEMSGMKSHMEQMQADLQQMKSRVAKMRSDTQKVHDPNTKAALLDNADMWDQLMNHMQAHMDMMKGGTTMHHGGKKPQSSQPGQPSTPNPQ